MPDPTLRKPIRVYVAASSVEIDRAQHWMRRLVEAGITVTSTWPVVVAAQSGVGNPRDASLADRAAWSRNDLAEVRDSDVLWFLVPSTASGRGAYMEAGFAHGLGIPIISSGDTAQSIFLALGRELDTDERAYGVILVKARCG